MISGTGTSAWRADWGTTIEVHGEWLAIVLVAITATPHGFDGLLCIAGGNSNKEAESKDQIVHFYFERKQTFFSAFFKMILGRSHIR